MKVAIVVDYLNSYGGGERLLESILEVYPRAEVFTSICNLSRFPKESPIHRAEVRSVFDSGLKGTIPVPGMIFRQLVSFFPKHFTFLMPFFFEQLNLASFDLVVSVGTTWAKGVRTDPSRQTHIFYCLTPPRFLYGYPSESSRRSVWYYRPLTTVIDHWLRIWDFEAAQRPEVIFSISQEVRRRVKKFYRRDSVLIYPPIRVRSSDLTAGEAGFGVRRQRDVSSPNYELITNNYFLIVSRLAAYKGIEVAVEACNRLKLPLEIVGTGREESRLKSLAGPTVELLGFKSDEELAELYRNCQAVIFPTVDEDFGLVPLEANSFGKPVIAHRSGGVLETQIEGQTAFLYDEDSVGSLSTALTSFDPSKFKAENCVANAQRFSEERFKKEFQALIESFTRAQA